MPSLQAVSQHVEDTWDGPMDFDFDPISGGDVEPSRLLLKPVEKAANDGVCRLQCTECHRVVTMRFCSACGHQFEPKVVDARMEIPGVNVLELWGHHN